jgi:hypothetical protein
MELSCTSCTDVGELVAARTQFEDRGHVISGITGVRRACLCSGCKAYLGAQLSRICTA